MWALVVFAGLALAGSSVAPGGGSEGQIWLDCIPGEQSQGGGWQSGGIVCLPGAYGPDAVLDFTLVIDNRDNVPQTALQIPAAIHSATTSDDLLSLTFHGAFGDTTYFLGSFGTVGFNPFDDGSGGKHTVYHGDDAIWVTYPFSSFNPALDLEEVRLLPVTVVLGPSPSDSFEMHFDAFDLISGAKTPNGHDVTLINSGAGNTPPEACITFTPSATVNEGDLVTVDGSCSTDSDGTIVAYEWDLDTSVDTDGDSDPSNDVDATGASTAFTWYDDYVSTVKLTVTDDDGAQDTATGAATVLNVDPTSPGGITVSFTLDVGCRLAGSKWSNVHCQVIKNYGEAGEMVLGDLEIERWPGSPDDNPTSTGSAFLTVSSSIGSGDTITVVVTYDPFPDLGDAILGDQPNNGKDPFDNAGNPVWVIVRYADGTECSDHHTFNTQQSIIRDSDHWNHVEPWVVGPIALDPSVGAPVDFSAAATDPGSDDITFTWDWGDSTMDISTFFFDGAGADPLPSPYEPYGAPFDLSGRTGTVPASVVDTQTHSYAAAGTYTVSLTISDDDGGFSVYGFVITVVDGGLCG